MAQTIHRVQEVARHRNGVSGAPFYAVRFQPTATPDANFLATVFDEPGCCAVICLDAIAEAGVAFGQNSYRGDYYEPELREAIETYEQGRASSPPEGFTEGLIAP